jgi:AT hook motif
MAERVMIVCDVCGAAPAETVGIRYRDRNLQKDLCVVHIDELTRGARLPRRGRPRSATVAAPSAAPRRRGRPRKVAQS